MRKSNYYAIHRWLGLLVSLQLLAWSIGGLAFSILDVAAAGRRWTLRRLPARMRPPVGS